VSGVNEFSFLVGAIARAAQLEGADIADLIGQWSPKIADARDATVAAALNAQAEFYWEASTLLDPTRAVAEANGEEAMTAVLDAQIRTMREVSSRLRRRAALFQGLSAEDQAIHEMAAATPTRPLTPGLAGLGAVGLPGLANDLADAYFREHPELDKATTSLEFRNGEKGWHIVGHRTLEHPPGFAVGEGAAAAAELCCACCAVGDGKCYCNNSGKPKTKWCKCVPCKTARDNGQTAQEIPK
jgi:hypothetical protein